MSAIPDLTVTVVSWNTRDLLRACLNSVTMGAARTKVEVHVVDNFSADGSAEMVRDEFPQVHLIANQDNVGFARANNRSWREAKGRYWLLLNSDAEARPGALDTLVDFLDAHQQVGMATARLVSPDGGPQHCAQPEVSLWRPLFEALRLHKLMPTSTRARVMLGPYFGYDRDIEVGWTWGTALIARRAAVEKVGPLSDEFFMYGEDLEWCLRMRNGGWPIWFCAGAEVMHHGGQSSIQQWDDAAKQRVTLDGIYRAIGMHHNRIYMALLHLSLWTSLSVEWMARRVRGVVPAGLSAMVAYHRDAFERAMWS